jgi:ABC-type nitrate/sulfonate/bicarbonate transport system permease component
MGASAKPPSLQKARSAKLFDRTVQALFLVALLALWHGVTAGGFVSKLLLPSPVAVAQELSSLLQKPDFWHDVWITLTSIVQAYVLAVIGGLILGSLIGQSKFAYDVFQPLFAGAFAVPLIIIYPLILFLAGIGPLSKIIFAAIYGFLPVALAAMSAFANVPLKWRRYAATLTSNKRLITQRVLIPAAIPELMSGLRISYVVTFASVIAGEMIAAFAGLGRIISYNAEVLEPARMYAAIVVVILFAALVNWLMARLQPREVTP